MGFATPMRAARLERIKVLWRELQRTPPTAARYQTLVALIRAERRVHGTSTDVNHRPQTQA